MKKYYHIWRIYIVNTWQETMIHRYSNLLFILGKTIRFTFSIIFLLLLKQQTKSFAGYHSNQVIVFFLVFHIIDLISQILYRGVYTFDNKVRTGEFDNLLLKPANPLFTALMGKPDFNDLIFSIPSLAVIFYIFNTLNIKLNFLFIILFINGLIITTAIHIIILVIGILTTKSDEAIWIYRDLNQMGKFPITIYPPLIKFILFFIIPIGLITTIPTQALFQHLPLTIILTTLTFSLVVITISFKLWNKALKKYGGVGS